MMKTKASSKQNGFGTAQLVITIAVMAIITGFAAFSIVRARNHIRLMNSARQFAAYVERARADAVRRHNGAMVSVVDNNTYAVTMDWDGFGNLSTRNFDLEQGVVFTTGIKSVTFDWRGRITQEESFGFFVRKAFATSDTDGYSVSVGVTGSGDVTFDAQFFHDASLPPVGLNGSGGNVFPEPSPSPGYGSPTPSPSPNTSPSPGQGASPTPTSNPSPTPTANPSPTATATPNGNPSPGSTPTPNPSPTVSPCSLNASPSALTIVSNGSANVSVNLTGVTGTATISGTSSNSGQIQVTPGTRTVTGAAAASFKVTVKRTSGSVTFSSAGCSSKTVSVTVR